MPCSTPSRRAPPAPWLSLVVLPLLAAPACQPDPEALIVLSVSAAPALSGVMALRGTVTAGGQSERLDAPLAGPVSVPPAVRVPVYIPARLAGNVQLRVDAVNAGGLVLGSGITTVATEPGKSVAVTITLGEPLPALDGGVEFGFGDASIPDLATRDGGAPADADLALPADLTVVDQASPADLPRPVLPSNVPAGSVLSDADDMPVIRAIDTTTLELRDKDLKPLKLTGKSRFVVENDVAVLSVKSWTQSAYLGVSGSRPLVVVASGDVVINTLVDCGGAWSNGVAYPGPGGGGPGAGPGGGGTGISSAPNANGGGGGAGGGGAGKRGGDESGGGQGGSGGLAYGAGWDDLRGGSGGGNGGSFKLCPLGSGGMGGPGGGALQIFSARSITLGPSAIVDAAGAGGLGGCADKAAQPPYASGGGGGGSGGMILLEAPIITLDKNALLAANGGAGGGAADGTAFTPGSHGQRGMQSLTPAFGGAGGSASAGSGGNGGCRQAAPVDGSAGKNPGRCGGGAGAAMGRIYLRTRGNQLANNAFSSPAPITDSSL